MNRMGKHEAPIDGIVANGHAPVLVPLTVPQLQVRQAGPVTPWPQPAKPDRWRDAASVMAEHRGWLAAIPVVLVNAVAFYGQLAFLRTHLPAPVAVQALVAVALESIAVYLAWQAHLAQLADDSALRLRLAAYGMAALIAAMNYSHYAAAHWRPTFAAIAFALCSAISPWLWSVHSRRESRDALKAKGLIEPHAVRLGVTRWLWHPWRSPQVMWHATWAGENDPAKAIALAEASTAEVSEQVTPEPAVEVTPEPPVQVTPEPLTSSQPETPVPAKPQVKPRRKAATTPGRISDADLKAEIRTLFEADRAVSVNAAAKQLGRSRDRVRPLLEQVRAEAAS
jgi:hypothetical protein